MDANFRFAPELFEVRTGNVMERLTDEGFQLRAQLTIHPLTRFTMTNTIEVCGILQREDAVAIQQLLHGDVSRRG